MHNKQPIKKNQYLLNGKKDFSFAIFFTLTYCIIADRSVEKCQTS